MKIPDGQANDINIDNKIDVSDLQTFVHNEPFSNNELIMILYIHLINYQHIIYY